MSSRTIDKIPEQKAKAEACATEESISTSNIKAASSSGDDNAGNLLKETELLRDTLDLLLNNSLEQRKLCDQLTQENKYLQEYVENLMSSSNVLEK